MMAEYFHIIGQNVIISNDKLTITKDKYNWTNTTYGKLEIDSISNCICRWYLKFNKAQKGEIAIGISSSITKVKGQFYYDQLSINYAFWCFTGKIINPLSSSSSRQQWKRYGISRISCKTGDHIDIELNLYKKKIIFYVNGKNQGVAFNRIKIGEN